MSLILVKKAFFDQKKMTREGENLILRTLSKFGAFTRRTIQFSMKSKKGPSPAGTPPHAHGQKLLKRHTYFYLDKSGKSVVIGPIRLSRKASEHVPRLQEYGGVKQKQTKSGTKILRYSERAYTRPAARENLVKLPDLIRSKKSKP